mgnify:FL=1
MPIKSINSKADLAIHGAPPAVAEPLHVGRPNIAEKTEFLRRVEGVLDRLWLTNNGPLVQELEARIAEHLGVRHCIAMCNGTIALEIAIRALGLTGEVIVPSWTFIATAHALQWQQITPVFADIDARTHNLDPAAVRRMITPRTSGIIGVHLWGRPAPIGELQAIADEHHLKLLFDAAHAFGCSYEGQMIGRFGACEVLSFHATKYFSSFEGGAIVTNDDALMEKVRLMRNFGFAGYDNVIHPGTNGKLTEVCAAMGLTNLQGLSRVVARNRANHGAYQRLLSTVPGVKVLPYDESQSNNFHYVVAELAEDFPVDRDAIVASLHAENILVRKYFWPGCHLMQPYRSLFPHAGLMLPITEAISRKVIVFPNGDDVNEDVIETIRDVIAVQVH